jgi:putative spermidine/putrescine transport system substrate-binding protein
MGKLLAAFAVSTALMGGLAAAQDRVLVFMNSGGVLLEAQKEAFIKPFEEATGIKVVTVSPVDFAKIQTQVDANRVEVDVVEWNPEFAVRFCGTVLDKVAQDVDMNEFIPNYVTGDCGVPQATFVHTFFYKKDAFPDGPPKTWADFFDTKKFPGKRAVWNSGVGSNYEKALVADGVDPKQLYPLDLKRALGKWDTIRDDLIFWSTAAQLVQTMQEGSVELVDGWGPAATQAIINGADGYVPAMQQPIMLFNQLMIPKGAPHRAEAIEFIKYVTSPEAQARLVSNYPEGPTRKGVNPTEFKNDVLKQYYPGAVTDGINIDPAWRTENIKAMGDEWTAWSTR